MILKFDSSLISPEEIQQIGNQLSDYILKLTTILNEKDYDALEASIILPTDKNVLEQAQQVVKQKVTPKLKYFIDIGIGGSNLGTKAVYDALLGYTDTIEPDRFPKMIFVDTCDPEFLHKLQNLLQKINDPAEILINIISKSGTTTETIFNLEVVLQSLNIDNINERLVVTTDEGSKLWNLSKEKNLTVLPIPKNVGGRFSVFSNVGIFPLAAVGLDVKNLVSGAENMLNQGLTKDILNNPAAISAIVLYLQNKSGKNINDNFFFHPELESVGKWYRQLMGESIGKGQDLNGRNVAVGITPTVSIGSTDLHSMGQLYLGGPSDRITTFIYSEKSQQVKISENGEFSVLVQGVPGKTANQIMSAIFEGVKIAYTKKELPFMEVILEHIDESSLGAFLQFKMIEMMFLGKLLNVNTFDQPNVEDYKVETKNILNS